MQVLIFANPFSGTGPNRKRVLRLEEALTQQGLSTRVVWDRNERIPALNEAGDELQCVVAAGGDGSIADVLNDMQTAGCLGLPFATLPAGNENLFAQEFKFTGKPEEIADAIVRGETVPVDLACATDPERPDEPGRLFTLMTSAGFDADVVHRVDHWRNATADTSLKRVNRLSYAPRVVSAMLGYRFPSVTLEADGQTVTGHQAYVFNLPQYGGNLHIGKEAKRDDGQLAWVVFEKPGFVNLLGYHWCVLRGKHLSCKTVVHGRADRVTLRTGNGHAAPAQADGDPAGDTPLEMTVMPGAINVIRI